MNSDSFNNDLADFLADDDDVYEEMAAIEERCEEYIQLYRLGQAPTYAKFAAGFPDIASQIIDILPTIVAIEDARKKNLVTRNDGRVARGPEAVPTLGDYQIIREIGRGGMGIVYEAQQASLDRRVAIKVLPKFSLSESQVEKFHFEARTAAKLHHSNIAPVFDVGEKDGLHYYVMQLLNGDSLDAYVPYFESEETLPLLEELSQEEVVQVGLQVSSALHYAHSQNVLHRDIKPANLILDPDYNVWVTDFGLAKTESNINANNSSKTYSTSGKIVGTLRYIAPERIDGDQGGVRSDVYSLGVTLIELLSGRPAFQEETQAELIAQIRAGNFNITDRDGKQLARDLTAILEKSVAAKPADRYLSALEMNEDLQFLLDGHPVRARSASSFSAAWKWIKRNPEMTLASGIAAGLMLATLFVLTVSFLRIESVLESEKEQRLNAENNSKLAAQAMDRMFSQFSNSLTDADRQLVDFSDGNNGLVADLPQPSVPKPRLTKDTAKMLDELSGFYIQLAAQNNHDADLKVKAMMARSRVGEIHERLGQYDQAISSFRIALDGYQKLIARKLIPNSNDTTLAEARLHNQIGFALKMSGKTDSANREHNKAIQRLQTRLGKVGGSDVRLELELARSFFLTANENRPGLGPTSLPSVHFSEDWTHRGASANRPPAGVGPEIDAAQRAFLTQAVELLHAITSDETNPMREHLLASCYRELASDRWATRSNLDRRFHAKSISMFESLARKFPDQPTFRFELMRTLAEINVFEEDIAKVVLLEANESISQSIQIGNELVLSEPDVTVYRVELVHANFKLAQMCRKLAKMVAGDERKELVALEERHLRQSLTEQTFLARQYPDSIAHKVWVTRFALSLAKCEGMKPRKKNRNRLIARVVGILNRLPEGELDKPEIAAIMVEAKKISHLALMDSDVERKALPNVGVADVVEPEDKQ